MSKAVTALADWITRGIEGHAESDVEYGLPDEVYRFRKSDSRAGI